MKLIRWFFPFIESASMLNALWRARIEGEDDAPADDPDTSNDDGADDADYIEDGDGETDVDSPDAGGEDDSDAAPPRSARSRDTNEVEELRERTRRLEADIEAQRRVSAGPSEEQRQWEQEQRLLDDANTSPQDRHAIQTNRALRQSHALSQQAHARAEDLSDKAEYQLKALDNPVYRKYAARVEAERERLAAAGRGRPPREIVLQVLIGQDVLKGKVSAGKPKSRVARQAVNRPRSDVRANSGRNESDKRRQRLENQII